MASIRYFRKCLSSKSLCNGLLKSKHLSSLDQKSIQVPIFRCFHKTLINNEEDMAKKYHVPSYYDRYVYPEPPDVVSESEHKTILSKVNECIENNKRLFAIVSVNGKQFKVTTHDLILVDGYIPAECGEKIRLEKVLLVGGKDFTLVGRPLVKRSFVKVEATIVEKTPGIFQVIKKFKPRKRYERTHKLTPLHTTLRINCIEVLTDIL